MPTQLARTACLIIALASLALVGCQKNKTADSGAASKQRYSFGYPEDRGGEKPKAPAEAAPAPAPAPADGMVSTRVAIPTGERRTSGMLIEKMAPAEVTLNQPFEYTIQVTNLTGQGLNDVTVVDTVSENYELMNATPEAERSGRTVTWQMGSLGARESKTITLLGKATGEGMIRNCVSGSYTLAACVATKVTQPALQLAKTVTPEVVLCDMIDYELVVTNNGTGAASNVVVMDELPAGVKTADGMSTLKYNVGTLPAGQARRMTAKLKASKTGTFKSTAQATADGGLKDTAAGQTVVRQPVLEITKTAPDMIFAGRNLEYTIMVKNTGDAPARNLEISDGVPNTTSFVSASNNGRLIDGSVSWSLGTLDPGKSRTVTMTVKPARIGKVTNAAAANADCAEPVTDRASTDVAGIPAILLEVVDRDGGVDYDPVEVGNRVVYVITATNQGSARDTDIRITATPENAEFISATGATEGQFRNGTITFAPLRELGPKQQATWKVTVRAAEAGNTRFQVTMRTDELGERPVEETEATNFYE